MNLRLYFAKNENSKRRRNNKLIHGKMPTFANQKEITSSPL